MERPEDMSILFNTTEFVEYSGTRIAVHWIRQELTKKTNMRLFEGDDGTVRYEKDYISFEYRGRTVEDHYEADEDNLGARVFRLCSMIDKELGDQ